MEDVDNSFIDHVTSTPPTLRQSSAGNGINRHVENQQSYNLISFAPSSGIGFYALLNGSIQSTTIHQFDITTNGNVPLLEKWALAAQRLEFDQVEASLRFDTLDELMVFVREEFLSYRKNMYYLLLFTRELTPELRQKTLHILDSPDYQDLPFSVHVLSILPEIAEASLVLSAIEDTSKLELRNVQECFANELGNVTFSPRVMIVPATTQIAENPERLDDLLVLLAECLSMARQLPKSAQEPLHVLVSTVEGRVATLDPRGFTAVAQIAHAVDYSSPILNLAHAIFTSHPTQVGEPYTTAVIGSGFDQVVTLSEPFSKMPLPVNDSLLEVGYAILNSVERWNIALKPENIKDQQLLTGLEMQPISALPEQPKLSNFSQSALQLLSPNSDPKGQKVAFRRSPSGLAFTLQIPSSGYAENNIKNYPKGYLDSIAFWTACYADPTEVLARVRNVPGQQLTLGMLVNKYINWPDYRYWPYWYDRLDRLDHLDRLGILDRFLSLASPSIVSFYNLANIISLNLLVSTEDDNIMQEVVMPLLQGLLQEPNLWHQRHLYRAYADKRYYVYYLLDPAYLVVNNAVAWLYQKGRTESSREVQSVIRWLDIDELSPFIQIVT